MNRTQRAKIRAAREALGTAREFKNDALYDRCNSSPSSTSSRRFKDELEIFKGKQKQLRRLKKYNGRTGLMSENEYVEVMGY